MSLSKLDLFPKLGDEYHVGTTVGGIISMMSIISVILLSSVEIRSYLNPPLRQKLLVDTTRPTSVDGVTITMESQPRLDVYINITFPAAPCYLLSFDVIDFMTQLPIPLDDIKSTFTRLSPSGQIIGKLSRDYLNSEIYSTPGSCYVDNFSKCYSCQEVYTEYQKRLFKPPALTDIDQCKSVSKRLQAMREEGCNIESSFKVIRFAGNFMISPGMSWNHRGWQMHFVEPFGIATNEINMTHHIERLQYSKNEEKMPLDNFTNVQTENATWKVIYTADILDDKFSVSRNAITNPSSEQLGVIFKYDISPIQAMSYLDKEPKLHLATRLLTVVGGVLGFFTMIDRAIYMSNKRKKMQPIIDG
ncbi:hypothetical protein TRFO_11952 [Tritrichomonas foetus]|uniref:Endoplasmic reticulum-Golgi intermediate compartment protein 3 n=1 Tax=Tritrichomonas foetus TaxID=1144522 RepID=A0A1J4J138_9EUKA|nr:hypothetical protein TRFO_11952 [Tritrichomonas foetus]|eukprot:OHS93318.1 hypothetical protein TRFO_11952 [Tritrichomonas foetus]